MVIRYFFSGLLIGLLPLLSVQAQDILVSPNKVQASLFPGEITEAEIILTNNSEEELVWRPNTDAFLLRFDRLNNEYNTILEQIPDYYPFAYDGRDFFIDDGGNNMYDGGNVINTNLTESIAYSDSLPVSSSAFGAGSRYFTRHFPGLFVMAVDQPAITNFVIGGNLGADNSGEADVATTDTVINSTEYRFFIKRVFNAGVPSVNHLIIVENPGDAFHSYSLITETDYHEVKQLEDTSAIHYLLFAGKEGRYYTNAELKEIAGSYLNLKDVTLLPSWLIADARYPLPDTLLPGESLSYRLGVQPAELKEGNYSASLNFRTNNGEYSELNIPVSLQYRSVLLNEQLKDSIINEGFTTFSLPLSELFSAREGQSLTYSSQAENENIVSTRIEGEELTIDEAGLGTTQITIQANDQDGFSSSASFSLRVNDIPDLLVQLPDTTVSPLFDDYRIALDTVFADSDADALQFSVSSSDEAIATALLEEGILRIQNQSEGQSTISLTANDGAGGITTTSFVFTADYTAGIQDLKAAGIEIFPNPIERELRIGWKAGEPIQKISLHNLQGRLLYRYQPAAHEKALSIPASDLPAGMYLLSISTKQKSYSLRLVKP